MEFEFFVGRSTITNHFIQPLQNPAINERCSRPRGCLPARVTDPGCSRKIVKIPKQDTQRVSNAAICVAQTREHFLRERSEEHTSELQSQSNLVCRLLLDKKKE